MLLATALICLSPALRDGDTIANCAGEVVRLHGMNAPERHQPFATEATIRLQQLTRGQVVCTPTPQGRDRYGRVVAICAGITPDVGETLVREGLAVDLPRFSRGAYADEEAEAKRERRGMWR